MLKGLEAIVAELEQRVRAFRYSDSALRATLFYLLATGTAKRNDIALATGLSRQNIRTLVQKWSEGGIIHTKTTSNQCHVTICWGETCIHCKPAKQPARQPVKQPASPPSGTLVGTEGVPVKKIRGDYVPSLEAQKCLECWRKHRKTNPKHDVVYLQAFDTLRKRGVDWEGERGIYSICRHALRKWSPGMILSPSKLLRKNKTYPELETWEVIIQQIEGDAQRDASKPDTARLSFSEREKIRQENNHG